MSEYERAVFISYARGGEREAIVNQIDQALQQRGITVIRDKPSLGYRGSIKEFMERTGQASCVIAVISDAYLRSPNSMFELVEIADIKQFHDRIFPIVFADANIYDPVKRLEYVKFWDAKRLELAEAVKSLTPANLQGVRDDMDLYDRIRDTISALSTILKDMNTLTPEMHQDSGFSQLYEAIERRLRSDDQPENIQSSTQAKVQINNDNIAVGALDIDGAVAGGVLTVDKPFPPYQVRVITQLNIRNGPGTSFTIVGQMKDGDVTQVANEQTDEGRQLWGQIGTDQWISLSNQTVVKVLENGQTEELVSEDTVTETQSTPEAENARVANLLINNRSQAVFNDQARGEDQLGIKEEVEALAETLLLRDVEPPVAVGIMGGWGSGKSFVMYLISRYVEQTRARIIKKGWATKEEDSDVPAYVGHIYQINFNAWTYAKSNLWASLMDTIFFSLNRQMQIEQLLAHRGCSPTDTTNLADEVRDCMLVGGKEFIKIYGDGLKFDQDKDLEEWKENLEYWAHHLFKGNLLWSVMRRRQEQHLDRLKDTEEQLKQLKSRREQFEKSRSPEKKSVTLDAASAKACAQTLVTSLAAFIPEQVSQKAMETLKKQNVAEEDIDQALKDVWEIKGLFNTILKMFSEYKSLRGLTVLFLLIGIALAVLPEFQINFAERTMAMAASFAATLLPLITSGLSWVQKVANFNAKAKVILEDAYKNQQAKQAEEIANSTKKSPIQKITELQNEVSQGSLAAYDTLINLLEAQAEAERQLIGPSAKYSNLMEFVQSRLDAATYENQLGLMHQVRQDIDELTYSLADGAREDVFPRGKPRVILYIDDLDRCPPQRVVEILEAVQLLLNTKLFVIIMGLDTRYVTRALEKEYKEILQHEGDPSGLDYIEKIIQIPYRVRPIERDNLPNYLAMQMDVEEQSELETESLPQEQDHVADILDAQAQPSVDLQQQSGPVTGQPRPADQTRQETEMLQPVAEDEAEASAPGRNELPAAVIQFKKKDLVDLTACCQQISLSPRSIKRLVNVFKLMKIFWFRARKGATLADRDEMRPVKQAAMSLLALSSAYPEVMREVFVYLEGLYRRGQEQTLLFTALNNIKLPAGSARELAWQLQKYKIDIDRLKTMPGDKPDGLAQLTLRDFKLSNFNIVRSFSFVGDPVYWTDGEEDTSRANGNDLAKPASKSRAPRKSSLP